ncbi:MAG: hypothetical protein ABSG14_00175 [Verrucomicrobiia bacterium]|jgi:hypothetical protein
MRARPGPTWAQFVARPHRALAVILTLAAGYLHILVVTHAGALWRDEAGTLGLATLPDIADTWRMLAHNADPILFPFLVRVWAAWGLDRTDLGLRMLGCVIGLSLITAIWFGGRRMRITWPVLSLALLATNLPLVRWGDSLRPYGLGSALLLFVVGSVWSFVSCPSRKRYLIAAIVGVLSAQCLYQDSFLLLATCCSGAIVCLRRKQRREGIAALCIGLPAALSVVPYARLIVEAHVWLATQSAGFHPFLMWIRFFDVLDSSVSEMHWVWLALLLLALGVGGATLATGGQTASADPCDLPVFASLNLIFGMAGLLVFHWIAKFPIYPWHWLPALVFAAVNMEAALTRWAQRIQTPWLVLLCLMSLASFPAAVRGAKCAHTNLDVVAAQLSRRAEAGDVIVVYPWYLGITFARYYTGSVEWVTLPPVNDLRFHRYDLVTQDMLAGKPIKPVLDRVEQALASGHRVWLVGGLPGWKPGETETPHLPPAPPPNTPTGSLVADYSYDCGRQAADFLSKHAQHTWLLEMPVDHCLIGFETAPVFVVAGWKSTKNDVSP